MAGSSRSKRKKEKPAAAKGGTAGATPTATAADDAPAPTGFFKKLQRNMGINSKLDEMTLGEVVSNHPLVRVGKYVFIPYLLYYARFYLRLQHPEYVSKATGGLVNLRPVVHGADSPRQVLIVATPGSGTVQMASELKKKLGLEIGHETTDAAWDWTRDGTVSWFHGVRFFTEPKDSKERIESMAKICNSNVETISNMGFHPAAYGPPKNNCSYRSKWDECWRSECFVTLLKEWGCGVAKNDKKTCDIEFAKNIQQVRNPMHTLESLVVKYCVGGLDGPVQEPFLVYASALFPSHDFYKDSCIEATGTFMVMYLEAMVEARMRGDIDAFYCIEESSACDVAEAAGLLSNSTTVYEPNHIRVKKICDNEGSSARKAVEKKLNAVNKDQVKLGWSDLGGGKHGNRKKKGDRSLEGRIKDLFSAFGYDETAIPAEYDDAGKHSEL
ncbi:hypothetical protein ACHAXT_002496 [Thalassiosira profunda]